MSQTQLLSKKSSLQQKHSLNSTSSKQPRQHMSNKHKGIIKNDKNVEMSKSSRQNFLKGQKKSYRHKSHKQIKQSETEKAFSLHRSAFINQAQCIFSLKMLGCMLGEEDQMVKVKSLIKEKHHQGIDLSAFQDIYSRIYSKQTLQITKQLFNLLSRQKESIQTQSIQKIAEIVEWKGNAKDLIKSITGTNSMSFQEFNKIMNSCNAFS